MAAVATKPFLFTTIGKKYVMGVSGLIWAGFVLSHMAGNLLLFLGPDAYNSYGHAITSSYFIYAAEAVLIGAFLAHVFCAISLTIENRAARGSRYAVTPHGEKGATLASKTMAVHGTVILVFLILHILTFKFGTYYETTVNGVVMRDLHRLVTEIFQRTEYVVGYIICLILLMFHLSHGVSSMFQSFGFRPDTLGPILKKVGWIYAIVVAGGFIAQPLYFFLNAR